MLLLIVALRTTQKLYLLIEKSLLLLSLECCNRKIIYLSNDKFKASKIVFMEQIVIQ